MLAQWAVWPLGWFGGWKGREGKLKMYFIVTFAYRGGAGTCRYRDSGRLLSSLVELGEATDVAPADMKLRTFALHLCTWCVEEL